MKLPFPMLMLLCFAIPCGIAWQLDWAGSGNPGISPNAGAKDKSVAKPGSRQPCPVRAEESAAGQRSRIHNWAAHASAGDLYATLRDIPGLPVELCDEVRAICMRRLCELDPKGAIIFAGTAFSRREETRALTRECLQNLILQDPEKTMEFLDQLPWHLRQEGSRIALQSLAVSDHPASAMLCRKLEERWPGWASPAWLARLARKDPAAARAIAHEPGGSVYERGERLNAVAAGLAETDPAAAWQCLISAQALSGNFGSEALRILGIKDPASVLAMLDLTGKRNVNVYGYCQALKNWARTDPEAALARLVQSPEPQYVHQQLASEALSALAGTDFAAAEATFRQLPGGLQSEASVSALVRHLAHTDPAAALTWATNLRLPTGTPDDAGAGPGNLEQAAIQFAFECYLKSDPASALQHWQQHPGLIPNLVSVANQFSPALAALDPALQEAILAKIPADQRIALVPSEWQFSTESIPLVSRIIAEQPEKAPVENQIPSRVVNSSIPGFVGNWATQDPGAAAAWAGTLRDNLPDRPWIDANIAANWARQDTTAATAWVKSLADPGRREFASCYLGQEFCKQGQWQAALDLALTITNPELQGRLRSKLTGAPPSVLSKDSLNQLMPQGK